MHSISLHNFNVIKYTKMAEKVVTGKVRLSYVTVFEPRAVSEGSEKKYSVSILISKENTAEIAKIEKAVAKVIASSKDILGKSSKGLKTPLRDGDEEKDGDEYEGMMFLTANSKNAPILVDQNRQEIIDEREIYSGCYGRISMNLYAFNTGGNRGVACGLNSVQKLADGESFGGTYTQADMENDFDEYEDDEDDDLL